MHPVHSLGETTHISKLLYVCVSMLKKAFRKNGLYSMGYGL